MKILEGCWPIPMDALTICGWVFVKTGKATPQLIAHESQHATDYQALGLFGFLRLYATTRGRIMLEARGYRAQVDAGASLLQCATLLADNYCTTLTVADAIDAIQAANLSEEPKCP